jgi:hypothetical protein
VKLLSQKLLHQFSPSIYSTAVKTIFEATFLSIDVRSWIVTLGYQISDSPNS